MEPHAACYSEDSSLSGGLLPFLVFARGRVVFGFVSSSPELCRVLEILLGLARCSRQVEELQLDGGSDLLDKVHASPNKPIVGSVGNPLSWTPKLLNPKPSCNKGPPLLLPGIVRFRWYKTPDGKPLNAFGFEDSFWKERSLV